MPCEEKTRLGSLQAVGGADVAEGARSLRVGCGVAWRGRLRLTAATFLTGDAGLKAWGRWLCFRPANRGREAWRRGEEWSNSLGAGGLGFADGMVR